MVHLILNILILWYAKEASFLVFFGAGIIAIFFLSGAFIVGIILPNGINVCQNTFIWKAETLSN